MLFLNRFLTLSKHYLLDLIGKSMSIKDLSESTLTSRCDFLTFIWLCTYVFITKVDPTITSFIVAYSLYTS
jgi:hypothetical protein